MENETQSSAYDYLYATIMTAEWITSGYKELAEKYRNHPALKELYMCICDGVNIDLLELISIDDDAPEVLYKCRKQYLESDFTRKYQDAIDRITVITKTTENELKSLSGTVKQIAENIPVKDEAFFLPMEEVKEEQFVFVDADPNDAVVTDFGTEVSEECSEDNIQSVSIQRISKNKNLLDSLKMVVNVCFRRNPKNTVISMLEQGYKEDQITFVLKCMAEGMSEKEINEIAAPELSVQQMELLRKIKKKEKERNGTR